MFLGQLDRSGFHPAPADRIEHARESFASSRSLLIRKFLEPRLLADWQRRIDAAPFTERVAKGDWGGKPPSVDMRADDRALWGGCIFQLNDPELFEVIERVTGCEPIGSFFGSVYRIVAGMGHFHTWHNDLDGNRMVALSINLSPGGYRGGVLQLANRESHDTLAEIANTGWGDAAIFEISESLEHRVTAVEPGPDKTAFAGWFVRSPSRAEWLRGTDV
ncbi:MAG TPA: 2OG-Fe(II) oxygenase [Vicinamibacterales bacterium]|jgi:hypothetical protein|nr:2OG-Fe(II) oxygenase [Vicinamibacterales bacterium]